MSSSRHKSRTRDINRIGGEDVKLAGGAGLIGEIICPRQRRPNLCRIEAWGPNVDVLTGT